MRQVNVEVLGIAPLLMHNERLANPLNPAAQALAKASKKRGKSDDDHILLGKLEFIGGLYHHEDNGPYLPQSYIISNLQEAAKKKKLGKVAKAAIFMQEMQIPLIYEGPKDVEGLYKAGFFDQRTIRVSNSRIVRTRPMFTDWSVKFTLDYDETVLNKEDVKDFLETGGKMLGYGDYRPRFGRFELVSFK